MAHKQDNGKAWSLKDKMLMFFGFVLIAFVAAVWAFAKGHPFQVGFLLAGVAFCGVSISQMGDKQ